MSNGYDPYNNSPTRRRRPLVERILGVFLRRRPTGWTDDELERHFNERHQTISARRREMVQWGILRDTGRKRATRSGRPATVWVLE